MRIRSTKPEFWRSKTIAALPWDVRLVLKGVESYVDDNGVGKDDIALIAADVFPRDLAASPRDTLARLSEAISALADGGLVVRYEMDGEQLIYVDRWKQQQRIDKPARGRFRRPDGTLEYTEDVSRESYASPRDTLASPPEVLAPGTGEQGNRGTGEQTASPTSTRRRPETPAPDVFPPTDSMRAWISERGIGVEQAKRETTRFLDYHRSKDNRHRDWEAAWRNWMDRVTPDAGRREDTNNVIGMVLDVGMQ